ncbi:hypothetical protein NA56DRAFT_183573 [Hyaloscypha hepaticicola]|uniref:Uncharacterized protein n=1 Tax=Hyaloscypha hepaticicola TaxID=2082293 RepID=A0A2J6Q191_9HELO|nr:hypothetical protein NA56DRAFT_183573 [Hyaloscypha hepaticicola]
MEKRNVRMGVGFYRCTARNVIYSPPPFERLSSSVDDTFAAFIPSRLALINYITCICRFQETIRDIKLKQHHKRLLWASLETDARHSF